MTPRFLKTVARGLVLALGLQLALPAVQANPAPAATAAADDTHKGISGKLAVKLYETLDRGIDALLSRANRSDRVNLKKVFRFLDDEERMIFDIAGTVRVKVPTDALRTKVRKWMEGRETQVLSSNGPISTDIAITPVREEGEEFLFAVQIDLIILTHTLFGQIARSTAQVAGVMGLNLLASNALDALSSVDWEIPGKAIEMGVRELPNFLVGEAGAITYATFQDEEHKKLREKLKATITPKGLLKHFTLALCFAGVTGGMKILGASVGGAVAAVLIPGGGTFLGTVLATSALVWFGNWAVTWVAIKLPVLWKLAKIGRLYRKANKSDGGRQERLSRKLGEYRKDVAERAVQELSKGYQRWTYLNMVIAYFRKRVKKADPNLSPLEAFDLVPYQPLLDALYQKLTFMAMQDENWYAARMYYQLLDSVNQLDRANPDLAPRGAWSAAIEAADAD